MEEALTRTAFDAVSNREARDQVQHREIAGTRVQKVND
jgi:hypothetical protein